MTEIQTDDGCNARLRAITRLAALLNDPIAQARTCGDGLAPFIGVAHPGQIERDGTISEVHGTSRLPAASFRLAKALAGRLAADGAFTSPGP